jgi:hypothetical protein
MVPARARARPLAAAPWGAPETRLSAPDAGAAFSSSRQAVAADNGLCLVFDSATFAASASSGLVTHVASGRLAGAAAAAGGGADGTGGAPLGDDGAITALIWHGVGSLLLGSSTGALGALQPLRASLQRSGGGGSDAAAAATTPAAADGSGAARQEQVRWCRGWGWGGLQPADARHRTGAHAVAGGDRSPPRLMLHPIANRPRPPAGPQAAPPRVDDAACRAAAAGRAQAGRRRARARGARGLGRRAAYDKRHRRRGRVL